MPFLIILLATGLGLWLVCLLWNAFHARDLLALSETMSFPLRGRPRVSILIPARNEAEMLSTTLPGFLSQDYDDYEVILVDDASTDGTGEVGKSFASRYPDRLRVIRVEELPAGWAGKPHALHTAFQAARGDWVLATDADICFHARALRAGLWAAEQHHADLVSIYTYVECLSFWEKLLLPGFSLMLSTFFPLRRINNPRSTVALASGGYILMRRQVWAGLGGYEAIRSEMIDDLNTARIVKHSGHRILAVLTKDLVRTRMYANLEETWEGLRKNAFAGNRFSVFRLLSVVGGILLCNLLPLACLLYYGVFQAGTSGGLPEPSGTVLALSLAQYGFSIALHLPLVIYYQVGWGYALLSPLGAILYACIALDSMARTLLGKGVSWKLRHYGRPPLGGKP